MYVHNFSDGNDLQKIPHAFRIFVWSKMHNKLRVHRGPFTCDVVPEIDACHIRLGRPWKNYKRTLHDGYNNTHTFWKDKKKIVLKLMREQIPFKSEPDKGDVNLLTWVKFVEEVKGNELFRY